jgi:hypothetical protein
MFPVLVHNQCSDFELVSPVYFGHDITWHILPDDKVDANTMTRASFSASITISEFKGALMYKLQGKKHLESSDQSNADNIFTKDTSTNIRLLVVWRFINGYEFYARALLIKHGDEITWNEDTLEKLHFMHLSVRSARRTIKSTWLLDDATVLMTTSEWKEHGHAIEIAISEGIRKDDSIEPLWVSSSICD